VSDIQANLERVRADIASAAEAAGRTAESVSLLAVCKTFPPEAVDLVAKAGQRLFGENRVQEAEGKISSVQSVGLEWHLIGHLQSNKARRAVQLFDVIQTVDSEKIARILDRQAAEVGKKLRVLIEVNVGDEAQKAGAAPATVPALALLVSQLPNLELRGLMAIPPYLEEPEMSRPYFRRLAQLLASLNAGREIALPELSMGMSHDFRVAIEEGSTLVRIGTAIFGSRNL
jgi:PLP dependent protein